MSCRSDVLSDDLGWFLFKYTLFAQKYGKSAALLYLLGIWDLYSYFIQ